MPQERPISEAFFRVAELADALGQTPLNKHFGAWQHQVDDQWRVAVNAHSQPFQLTEHTELPAHHIYVEFLGWPAGLINAAGGLLVGASEAAFIAALNAAIERAKSNTQLRPKAR